MDCQYSGTVSRMERGEEAGEIGELLFGFTSSYSTFTQRRSSLLLSESLLTHFRTDQAGNDAVYTLMIFERMMDRSILPPPLGAPIPAPVSRPIPQSQPLWVPPPGASVW